LAYAIFSEYIPLAKNNTSVVTDTNNKPDAKYGCNSTWISSAYISGKALCNTILYGIDRNEVCSRTSDSKKAMAIKSWARNTI
jgi:hypothetical protein